MTTFGYATTFPSQPPLDPSQALPAALPVIEGYEITACIGRGGCASVYEARHEAYGLVALKLSELPRIGAGESDRRLAREAALAQRIEHPNVLEVLDLGYLADGAPYLVMERLRGEDLETSLTRLGRLPVPVACLVMRSILRGLTAVHRAGVVHRDLKPNNIVVHIPEGGEPPVIKLIDFGVARGIGGEKLTRTGTVIGTPQYLSPEQARGGSVDARADIWAAGVLFYELLVGEGPFERPGLQETLASILFSDVPSVRERRPDVAPVLERVIATALDRELGRRYESASTMCAALEEAMHALGIPSEDVALTVLEPDAEGALARVSHAPTVAFEGSRSGVRARGTEGIVDRSLAKGRMRWFAIAVAAAGVLFGGARLYASRADGETPSARITSRDGAPATVTAVTAATVPIVGAAARANDTATETPAVLRAPSAGARPLTRGAALSRESRARSLAARGRVALANGRYDAAYAYFDDATELDPESGTAWRGFGTAAYQLGHRAEARRAIRRARALGD